MVIAQRIVEYPPLESLFDSESVKAYSGRRAVYCVDPNWKPTKDVGLPFDHQHWALGCILQHPRFLVLADTGLGKTRIALEGIQYAFTHWNAKHALVLTGRPISTDEWVTQAAQYINISACQIAGTPAERRSQLEHYPRMPITVSDYATLQTTFAKKQLYRKKMKFMADRDALAAFGRQFDAVVLDEIHRLKNPSSLRFQMVDALVPEISIRWGLTGTIFDRHPEDAWAQFHLIDDDETFGSRHDFLTYFFDEKDSYWNKWVKEYKIRKSMKDEFKRRVRHRALRIASKECKNIPDVHIIPTSLRATAEQRIHIRATQKSIRDAYEREERISTFQHLRQLVSGLLRVKTDAVDTTVRLPASPKINWVVDFLDELPEDEQVVIFYEFRESGVWLNEALTAEKHKVSWLYGGVKDEMTVLGAWKAKKHRILLTQTEKASESLNLQQCRYLVQFETPLTYRLEKQSLARVGGRIGGRPSIVYKLLIRNCIEQRILELIREGKELSQELLEGDDDT